MANWQKWEGRKRSPATSQEGLQELGLSSLEKIKGLCNCCLWYPVGHYGGNKASLSCLFSEVLSGRTEKLLQRNFSPNRSHTTAEAQRYSAFFTLFDFQNLAGQGPEQPDQTPITPSFEQLVELETSRVSNKLIIQWS